MMHPDLWFNNSCPWPNPERPPKPILVGDRWTPWNCLHGTHGYPDENSVRIVSVTPRYVTVIDGEGADWEATRLCMRHETFRADYVFYESPIESKDQT